MNTGIRIRITALMLLVSGLAAQSQELRIISSDPSGMTIEYRPEIRVLQTNYEGKIYTRYDIERADFFSADVGAPMIPSRLEMIGLPGLTGTTVTVLQADFREETNVLLVPNEDYLRDEESGVAVPVYVEGQAYRTAGWLPERIATLGRTGVARDRILGALELYPVQWDPGRKLAKLYTRLVVRVEFGPRDARLRTRDVRGATLPVGALNDQVSRNWLVSPEPRLKKARSVTLESGSWYAIPVTQEGMYKLSKSWFDESGIDISSVDPRTIRMFSNGGKELSSTPTADALEGLTEIAIHVDGEQDGAFGAGDYVMFYGKGLTGWEWDAGSGEYRHYIHRFASENAYYITFGGAQGKRMESVPSLNDPNPVQPPWFTDMLFVEDEETNILQSGKNWFSKRLTPGLGGGGDSKSYTMRLPGLVPSQPVEYRFSLYGRADRGTTNSYTITDNGVNIATIPMGVIDIGSEAGSGADWSGIQRHQKTLTYPDNRSVLTMVYSASDPGRNLGGYIDWVEWHYPRQFVAEADMLYFTTKDAQGTAEFTLNGFSMSDIGIYDISDVFGVRQVMGAAISGGTARFQASADGQTPRRFAAVALPAMKTPGKAIAVQNSVLFDAGMQADFVIITAADMQEAATTLKQHREQPGGDNLRTHIVTVNEIYSAFNCGIPDPTAIRNFLKFAVENWELPPRYVLLLGDGHYDYKNISTAERLVLPTWQSENSTHLLDTYPSDDYFVQVVGNDRLNDLVIGRITANTPEEARAAIEKTIRYDKASDFGPWRNRVTFVADDHLTTRVSGEEFHTRDSDSMAKANLPPGTEVKKIYIVSYKTESTAQGRRKPDANAAIIDQINEGTIAITYTGHGGSSVWAHESILLSDVSIPQMKNENRLTFLSAATCTFGLYDTPGIRSGTELMIMKPDGGAIGSLTAPRVVIAGQNYVFTRLFHEFIFIDGRESDGRAKPMGEAMYATKQRYNSQPGYEKFHLFGDPTQRLKLPRYLVGVERILINDQPVSGDSVQLKALSKVTFEASVQRADSTRIEDFNGTAQVSLYDSDSDVPVPEFSGNYSYQVQGGLLYRGQATIANGRFSVTFIMPKDISYQNKPGRVRFYIDNQNEDGAGYSTAFTIGGSDTSTANDPDGPELDLYMDSRRFVSGDIVDENSTMLADVYDFSGINTTGLGIGHNLEVWLNNSTESIIVNDYYRGEEDSYQKGVVEYPFKDLPLGRNTLRMRVWDIFNNAASAEIEFNVVSSAQLSLANVYNIPNPMTERTVFTFQYNRSEPVDAEIKIYTLSGRLVQTIEQRNITDRFVRVAWDGRDADGDRLANGVYFYKVVLRAINGGMGSEALGKLTVLR